MGIARSPLSKKRETSQWEAPFLSFPPFQIRSVRRLARIAFALLGPSTKRTASAMFDFSEPFGPVTDVYPARNGTRTFPAHDLTFSTSFSFRNTATPRRTAWPERTEG